MTAARPNAQPAEDRRTAEADVRTLVARITPDTARLVGGVRRRLRKRLPTAHEVVYEYSGSIVISFSPSERGYEGVLAVRATADGVRLYFNRAKALPDPEELLRGTGGQARWLALDSASDLSRPAVAALIDDAVAASRPPFPRSGRGSVIIRSTAAKKRRSRSR